MKLLNYINEAKAASPITAAIVAAVVEYGKRILGIPNADITVKHKKASSKKLGAIMLSTKPKKKYVVYVDLTRGYRVLIQDILHEMTHVKQIIKNELTLKGHEIQWKGKTILTADEYNNLVYDTHSQLPFEKESNENGNKIDDFLSSQEADTLRNSSDKNIKMIMSYL